MPRAARPFGRAREFAIRRIAGRKTVGVRGGGAGRGEAAGDADYRDNQARAQALGGVAGHNQILNGASVISSPFIGVELTCWKARTQPQVATVT